MPRMTEAEMLGDLLERLGSLLPRCTPNTTDGIVNAVAKLVTQKDSPALHARTLLEAQITARMARELLTVAGTIDGVVTRAIEASTSRPSLRHEDDEPCGAFALGWVSAELAKIAGQLRELAGSP